MLLRCFYCKLKLACGDDALNHAYSMHPDKEFALLVQQLEGRYLPKLYNWKPENHARFAVTINESDWKVIYRNEPPEELSSPLNKHLKLSSTPQKNIKSNQNNDSELHLTNASAEKSFQEDEIVEKEDSDDDNMSDDECLAQKLIPDNFNKIEKEIDKLMPEMMDFLQASGRLNSWRNFLRTAKLGNFPTNNIAFHLFMDVADWYSCESVNAMRYSDKVKRFWSLGYKLFRERFLRFMGGYKNIGQVASGERKGCLSTSDSQINFIAPSASVLRDEVVKCEVNCSQPGVIKGNLKSVDKSKSYKLCIDGKRINSGYSKHHGDVNLYGHEVAPTLKECEERLEGELQILESVNKIAQKRINVGYRKLDQEHLNLDILEEVHMISSLRLKELRLLKTKKELSIEYLKKSEYKCNRYMIQN
jgi:hypothetical protein